MPPFEPAGEPPVETEKERKKREKRERKEAKRRAKEEAAMAPAGAPGPAPAKKKKKKKKKIEEDDEEELERLKAALNDESGELGCPRRSCRGIADGLCRFIQKQAAPKALRQVRNMIKTTFAKEYDKERPHGLQEQSYWKVQRTKWTSGEDLPDPLVRRYGRLREASLMVCSL